MQASVTKLFFKFIQTSHHLRDKTSIPKGFRRMEDKLNNFVKPSSPNAKIIQACQEINSDWSKKTHEALVNHHSDILTETKASIGNLELTQEQFQDHWNHAATWAFNRLGNKLPHSTLSATEDICRDVLKLPKNLISSKSADQQKVTAPADARPSNSTEGRAPSALFVSGPEDSLSNFFPFPFWHRGVRHESVEQAYQMIKAHHFGHSQAWNMILATKSASEAKKTGDSFFKSKKFKTECQRNIWLQKRLSHWERIRSDVVLTLLKEKADQCPPFTQKLKESGSAPILHNVHDSFWGTGTRDPVPGTGKNLFGKLLEAVRRGLLQASVPKIPALMSLDPRTKPKKANPGRYGKARRHQKRLKAQIAQPTPAPVPVSNPFGILEQEEMETMEAVQPPQEIAHTSEAVQFKKPETGSLVTRTPNKLSTKTIPKRKRGEQSPEAPSATSPNFNKPKKTCPSKSPTAEPSSSSSSSSSPSPSSSSPSPPTSSPSLTIPPSSPVGRPEKSLHWQALSATQSPTPNSSTSFAADCLEAQANRNDPSTLGDENTREVRISDTSGSNNPNTSTPSSQTNSSSHSSGLTADGLDSRAGHTGPAPQEELGSPAVRMTARSTGPPSELTPSRSQPSSFPPLTSPEAPLPGPSSSSSPLSRSFSEALTSQNNTSSPPSPVSASQPLRASSGVLSKTSKVRLTTLSRQVDRVPCKVERVQYRVSKEEWKLPPITKPILIIGDSNLSRCRMIRKTHVDKVQIVSYPGAKFEHLYDILKAADTAIATVKQVILSIGINNRNQSAASTANKHISKLIFRFRVTFPNAKLHYPSIGNVFRETKMNQNLKDFETTVRGFKIKVLPSIPVHTEGVDRVHWTPDTANALLDSWLSHLN